MAKTLGHFLKKFNQPPNHVASKTLQPAPVNPHPHKPLAPNDEPYGNPNDADPHDHPGKQRVPTLSIPAKLPDQPAPVLSVPKQLPAQPAPALSVPADIPFQPAPALSVPSEVPFQPAPALSTPSDIPFTPPPALSTPAELPEQPAPPLSTPATLEFQPPPALSTPKSLPFQEAPALSVPRPTDTSSQPKVLGFNASGYADEWKAAAERQVQFFKNDVPRIAANMVSRALPRPGSIDPDLLPSTIATKALSAVANKVNNLENKYVFQPISNAGAAVSKKLTSVLVNSAPDGAYANSGEAASLEKINQVGSANPNMSLTDLFLPDKVTLNPRFKQEPKADRKYSQMRSANNAQFDFDDDRGQLDRSVDIGDAAASSYFPFYITDLRPASDGRYRTVFFKPFDLTVGESFAPNWNLQNFIGRVDPVATYQNTTRTLNVTFKMIAQHPSDLKTIYNKLTWLSSVVYPEYGADMRYRSGPVVRMRIGNLVNARSSLIPDTKDRPGLSGIITALDYNYNPIWEVEDDWQLAREVDVSFSFVALHELPIGTLNGEFGTIGVIDKTGIYMSPKLALQNKIAGANDQTPTNEKDYVDVGGFRKFGSDE